MNSILRNLTASNSTYTSMMFASGRWWPQPSCSCAGFSTKNSGSSSIAPLDGSSKAAVTESKHNKLTIPSPEELGLRKEDAFPTFAPARGPGKPVYSLVPHKDGEMLADYVLYEASIKKSEVHFLDYQHLTTSERDIYMAHLEAVENGKLHYIDPHTKKTVMTVCSHLYRGECCGSGCRHCPYDQENCSDEVKRSKKWNGAFYV